MKEMLYEVRCLKSNEFVGLMCDNCLNCPASARIISSFDFKHRTSYNISLIRHSFHGKTWAQQIDLPLTGDFVAQLVRALHRHRRGHGFKSRWVTKFFRSMRQLLNCPARARIISSFDYFSFVVRLTQSIGFSKNFAVISCLYCSNKYKWGFEKKHNISFLFLSER